jgi:hypothetical protein
MALLLHLIMVRRIFRAATFLELVAAWTLSYGASAMENGSHSCGAAGMDNGGSSSIMFAIGGGEGYIMEDDADDIFMDQHRSNMQVRTYSSPSSSFLSWRNEETQHLPR